MTAKDSGIPVFSWIDEPVKQSFGSVFHAVNHGVESFDLFKKFRKAQLESVVTEVEHVKILGMSAPQRLQDIYSPARFSTSIRRRLFTAEWVDVKKASDGAAQSELHPDMKLIDAETYIEKNKHIVILGGPGSGKTTLLKHVALAFSQKDLFETTHLKTSLLPIYVLLPHFAKADTTLFEYAVAPLCEKTSKYARDFMQRTLERGLGIVLLDSLDEVPVPSRKAVLDNLTAFVKRFPNTKILLTCRAADYEGGLESFVEVEIARLTTNAVTKIVQAWFKEDSTKGAELLRLLKGDRGVSTLTETPLLLSLLCIQYRHDLALPKRKTELYRRCIDTLLRDWDTTRRFRRDSAYSQLTDERKERIFEHLAFHYFTEGVKLRFSESSLIGVLSQYLDRVDLHADDARGVLEEIEKHHGILERDSADTFAFSHTSFHEYFVSRALISRRLEMDCVRKHLDDDNWSSVIEFLAAQQENPEAILELIMERSSMKGIATYPAMARRTKLLWLLYRCLCAGATVCAAFRGRVLSHLFESQLEMSRIYREGGVVPVGALEKDGVRHPFFWLRRKETLSDALQPYRMLANEMIIFPYAPYADLVLSRLGEVDKLTDVTDNLLSRHALRLCLIVPLASVRPARVKKEIKDIVDAPGVNGALRQIALDSLASLRQHYA